MLELNLKADDEKQNYINNHNGIKVLSNGSFLYDTIHDLYVI